MSQHGGADGKQRHTLRLIVEELCGFMEDRSRCPQEEHILTQLTLIAQEDGSFQLHLRNNGEEIDPFRIPAKVMENISGSIELSDIRRLVLQVAQKRTHQFLYRSYHGFNTMVVTI